VTRRIFSRGRIGLDPKIESAMSSLTISVIIPCFNHGEFLPEAVASITALNRDDLELIVVDDGSTDERTRTEIDALIAQGTKVIRQENKGLAAARNAGILASAGKYILPLDADDRLRGGPTEHGLRVLEANPQIGVVYGDAQCFGIRTNRWIVGRFDRDRLLQWNYIHASAIYRRSVWEQNRGYDGTMPVQGLEDWDFWLGALEHGWQFAYVPEVFFEYRIAKESMRTLTVGFEKQIVEFVAKKHGCLYGQAFLQIANEHRSLKCTFLNLLRLLKLRFKDKFQE